MRKIDVIPTASNLRLESLRLEAGRLCARCGEGEVPVQTTSTPFGSWFHPARRASDGVYTMDPCLADAQQEEMKALRQAPGA
jgi:hypothetical protein